MAERDITIEDDLPAAWNILITQLEDEAGLKLSNKSIAWTKLWRLTKEPMLLQGLQARQPMLSTRPSYVSTGSGV
jgi:hypothetical protein